MARGIPVTPGGPRFQKGLANLFLFGLMFQSSETVADTNETFLPVRYFHAHLEQFSEPSIQLQSMKTIIALGGLVCALFLSGCAATKQYAPFPDQAKRMEDPSKARIYVMRPASAGGLISMSILDKGEIIGETGPHGYLCWERVPGDATIIGTAEGISQTRFSAEAGKVYYIFQHMAMGMWQARNRLEILSEEEGRKVLKKCHPPEGIKVATLVSDR
jgi:hypothetical protein